MQSIFTGVSYGVLTIYRPMSMCISVGGYCLRLIIKQTHAKALTKLESTQQFLDFDSPQSTWLYYCTSTVKKFHSICTLPVFASS